MKKLTKIALYTIFMLPITTMAGTHSQGYLNIGDTYMSGSMNVRYNNNAQGYMMSQEWTNGTITFYGRKGTNTFLCVVAPNSEWFDRAFAAHYNLDNGATLYVTRTTTSTACTRVSFTKASNYLD